MATIDDIERDQDGKVTARYADLRGADLRGADLRGADLRGADMREANLRDADLRDADLRGASLWGADLRGASLWGADLSDLRRNTGLRVVTVTDRGYTVVASQDVDGTWWIVAGGRRFSVAEAVAHWGADTYHTPKSGRRVVAAIEAVEGLVPRSN